MTNDFLRAYFLRPEVAPLRDSCPTELALHSELIDNPLRAVSPEELAKFVDQDAVENYQVVLNFRDRLVATDSMEAAYISLFRSGSIGVPPLFIDQITQILVRHLIGDSRDPFRARAGELLFREQQSALLDGAILLGDKETVDIIGAKTAKHGGFGSIGELLEDGGVKTKKVELDVLLQDTAAERYWPQNEKFDTVLDITFARLGLDALCRVLELWVEHLIGPEVSIQPVQEISDDRWVWHVGLDIEATALLNDLYEGREVEQNRLENLLSLFRLEFKNPSLMRGDIAGRPVYLALCQTDDGRVRMKPQNLIVNLPLAESA